MRTMADVNSGNHKMTTVEIIYNAISFIVAVVATIAFTIYAKRALYNLKKEKDAATDPLLTTANTS